MTQSVRSNIRPFAQLVTIIVLSLTLVWSIPCLASSKKDKPKTFTGKVVALDVASRSLSISGKTGDKSFSAEKKLLKGIKVGDKVKITYTEKKGSQGVVKKIDHVRPKSDKKSGTKKSVSLHDGNPSVFCAVRT